ncbi:hypothetical protein [Pseudoalteromonas sp. MMG024]|uniref:hypothetical protein n=1 Tax=Pseudoalteromonas sp. MMG024 TaxID=2909980 RepID=UPI001F25A151|nr:hypothetical protein [Pseudoalteromonas sp. MMG024]MCF6459254.1 hypothetical protein [Pseudoalteromonas sp. MMG024]
MFKKEWKFNLRHHQIHIVYHYFDGMKLYVDGDLRDFSNISVLFSNDVLLRANLSEIGIIDVTPSWSLLSLEVTVQLSQAADRFIVYSSHGRVPLRAQRLISK